MKVILNKCFGGFHPSDEAYKLYAKKKGLDIFAYNIDSKLKYKKVSKVDEIGSYCFTKDFGSYVSKEDLDWNYFLWLNDEHREDPILIEVIEELGEKASSSLSHLVVVDIPDGLDYVIEDYDGVETLHEKVKTW